MTRVELHDLGGGDGGIQPLNSSIWVLYYQTCIIDSLAVPHIDDRSPLCLQNISVKTTNGYGGGGGGGGGGRSCVVQ